MDCNFICKTSLLSPFLVKCLFFILFSYYIFIITVWRQDADTNIDRKILLWPVPCTVLPDVCYCMKVFITFCEVGLTVNILGNPWVIIYCYMNIECQIFEDCDFLGYDMCTWADRYQCFGRIEQLEETGSSKTFVLHLHGNTSHSPDINIQCLQNLKSHIMAWCLLVTTICEIFWYLSRCWGQWGPW